MFTRDHSISENCVLSLNYWKLWFFKRAQFLRGVFPQNWSMVTWFAGFGSFVLMCVCTKIWHVKGGCRSNKHHSYATIIVQVPPRLPPYSCTICVIQELSYTQTESENNWFAWAGNSVVCTESLNNAYLQHWRRGLQKEKLGGLKCQSEMLPILVILAKQLFLDMNCVCMAVRGRISYNYRC